MTQNRSKRMILVSHPAQRQLFKPMVMDFERCVGFCKQAVKSGLHRIHMADLDMFTEINPALAMPFEDRFLGRPKGSQQDHFRMTGGGMTIGLFFPEFRGLLRGKKFSCYFKNLFQGHFNINPHPAGSAHNGGGIIPAMGNGKMVPGIRKIWFPGIGNFNQFIRETRVKKLKQKPSCQVL